jgi:hypothetical protein
LEKQDTTQVDVRDNKIKFVGIPIVNYSNSFAISGGIITTLFYNTSKKDTI